MLGYDDRSPLFRSFMESASDTVRAGIQSILDNTAHSVSLNSKGLGDDGARVVAEALEQNDRLAELYLVYNNIRADGARDIARVSYFLCCENTYITGQNIVVDGGYTIGGFESD